MVLQVSQSVVYRGRGPVLAAVVGRQVVEVYTAQSRKPGYLMKATAELEKLGQVQRGFVAGWVFVPMPAGDCKAPEPVYL